MEDIDILFFVEHRDREMQGTVEIKRFLESRAPLKIKVFSADFGLLEAWRKYNPKLVCMPYCGWDKNMMARAFRTRNPGAVFLNLNYEQILSKSTEAYKIPPDQFTQKELYHCAWGERFRDFLIQHDTEPSHVFVTGKPEIYFLQTMRDNSAGLKAKLAAELGLDAGKRWCFIPMSEGTAFYPEDALKRDIATGRRREVELYMHRVFYNQAARLVEMIARLDQEGGGENLEIILRPHPGVPILEYQRLMERLRIKPPQILHLLRDYTVKEWLCCADLCLSNWSTVLIDASAIHLPAYVFQPEPLPEELSFACLDVFEKLRSYEDFKRVLLYTGGAAADGDYVKQFVNTDLQPVEEMGRVMEKLLALYQAGKPRYIASLCAEGPRLLRSGVRNLSVHIPLFRRLINQRLLYDYFPPF